MSNTYRHLSLEDRRSGASNEEFCQLFLSRGSAFIDLINCESKIFEAKIASVLNMQTFSGHYFLILYDNCLHCIYVLLGIRRHD